MLARLRSWRYVTRLDMRSGYYHIKPSPAARHKSAFIIIFRKYKFLGMPFSLAQGPTYFTAIMLKVLGKFNDFYFFYKQVEDHIRHLKQIFEETREADLKLKLSRCTFLKRNIQYLGNIISGKGIYPFKEKVASLINHALPIDMRQDIS